MRMGALDAGVRQMDFATTPKDARRF
jgi:hypothetical protein